MPLNKYDDPGYHINYESLRPKITSSSKISTPIINSFSGSQNIFIGYSDYLSVRIDTECFRIKESVINGSKNSLINNIVRDLQSLIDDNYISDITIYENQLEIILSNMDKMSNYLEVLQELKYLTDSNYNIKEIGFSTTNIILEIIETK